MDIISSCTPKSSRFKFEWWWCQSSDLPTLKVFWTPGWRRGSSASRSVTPQEHKGRMHLQTLLSCQKRCQKTTLPKFFEQKLKRNLEHKDSENSYTYSRFEPPDTFNTPFEYSIILYTDETVKHNPYKFHKNLYCVGSWKIYNHI